MNYVAILLERKPVMRGYVLEGVNQVAWRDDLPEPDIGPLDATIKPIIVAPCTTDIALIETMAMPIIKDKAMGHEVVGIVDEIGSAVKDFKVGDRVAISSVQPNWRSLEAQDGRAKFNDVCHYYCEDPNSIRGGVFAEKYHVIDADMTMAHIPDSVTWEQAIMTTDMATTAFEGIDALNIGYGDSIAIIGIGPVGLMGVCAAVIKGAARVFGVGSRKVCQDVGRQFGVTDFINYKDGDIAKQILTKNRQPVDGVLVTGGTANSIAEGMRIVKYGGTVANVACFFSDETTVIPNDLWNYGGLDKTIKGIKAAGGRVYTERLLKLIEYGRMKPELMATHVFHGMDKIEDAVKLMMDKDPNVIKPLVFFD